MRSFKLTIRWYVFALAVPLTILASVEAASAYAAGPYPPPAPCAASVCHSPGAVGPTLAPRVKPTRSTGLTGSNGPTVSPRSAAVTAPAGFPQTATPSPSQPAPFKQRAGAADTFSMTQISALVALLLLIGSVLLVTVTRRRES